MADMNVYSDADIYGPVQRAQEFKQKQNALVRQQNIRNALAQSIDPATGRVDFERAYRVGGMDVAPELQEFQGAEATRMSNEDTALFKSLRDELEMFVNDQPSYDAWTNKVRSRWSYASFPPQFSPEVKNDLTGLADRLLVAGRTTGGAEPAAPQPRAPSGYRFLPDGSLEPIPGGPAEFQRTQATAREQRLAARKPAAGAAMTGEEAAGTASPEGKKRLSGLLQDMAKHYAVLRDENAITSTEKSPVENVYAAVRQSGVGQQASRVTGARATEARNSIINSRPLIIALLKEATGMSGKQLDSNAELQLYLNAASNPDGDLESAVNALRNIDSLFGTNIGIQLAPAGKPKSAPAPKGAPAGQTQKTRSGVSYLIKQP